MFNVKRAMDARAIEDRHLSTNKTFCQLVGIWPDQAKSIKYLVRVVTFIIAMSATVTVLAKVYISFNFSNLVEEFPYLLLGLGTLLKQYQYVFNESTFKELVSGVVSDWLTERPKEELMILEIYSRKAALFASFYKAAVALSAIMFLILPVLPPVLDFVMPLNESRERVLLYPAYYFVNQEEYYYFIMCHMLSAMLVAICVFTAVDMNLLYTVQHVCALFAISGYRFKHAIKEIHSHIKKNDYEVKDNSYRNICKSIDAHRKAFEYVQKIEDCNVTLTFHLILSSMMVLALTLIQISTMDISLLFLTYCMFIVVQLVHLFFLNVMGQFIVDANEETFNNIYEGLWYNSPKKSQLLYALVLHRCLRPSRLTGGKMIDINLATFLQIVKASFSYYGLLKTL